MNSILYIAFAVLTLLIVLMLILFVANSREASGFRDFIRSLFKGAKKAVESDSSSFNIVNTVQLSDYDEKQVVTTEYENSWKIQVFTRVKGEEKCTEGFFYPALFDVSPTAEREKHYTISSIKGSSLHIDALKHSNLFNLSALYVRYDKPGDCFYLWCLGKNAYDMFTDPDYKNKIEDKNIKIVDGLAVYFINDVKITFTALKKGDDIADPEV